MKKALIAVLLVAFSQMACQPPPEQARLTFAKPAHVSQCLDGLYAIDHLAQVHSGTQLGQRIAEAPWLRKSRHTQALGQQTKLTRETLGVQLMPMLALAQKSLAIEINDIPSHLIKKWQQQFKQTSVVDFINYCSKEAAFAQLQDSTTSLTWLKSVQIDLNQISSKQPSNTPNNQTLEHVSHWRTYKPEPTEAQRISYTQDLIGQPLLGEASRQALLKRYAPTWQIADTIDAKPREISTSAHNFKASETLASYAFFTTGLWNKHFVFQLNYIVWLNQHGHTPGNDAFIFRINSDVYGRAIAYETAHMSGADYQVYLPKNYTLTTPLTGMSVNTVKSAPSMLIQIAGKPARVVNLDTNSGTASSEYYTLLSIDRLYGQGNEGNSRSLFDAQAAVKTHTKNPLTAFLFGSHSVKTFGAVKGIGHQLIHPNHSLYFDDPKLLSIYGLQKTH